MPGAPADMILAETEFTTVSVSPGLGGFIAMFIIAALVVLLVVDMSRRVRRVQARERVEQRRAEEQVSASSAAAPATPSAGDPTDAEAAARPLVSERDSSGEESLGHTGDDSLGNAGEGSLGRTDSDSER